MNLEELVNQIRNDSLFKYISQYHSWFESNSKYQYEKLNRISANDRIRELLKEGFIVKGRYCATSIKGFHEHLIFYYKK